ncbi:hypothetical protein L1787_17970 [Acuticoccus sp. M5D2P5]|uniref:hypothetical protein n=1 Tax=Acuticoccus kalidii TaxID=2910977 RepID=UPI001F1ADAA3|nr:hypothetical protein [Acuticoccus kalidii]MCF3935290.1 hypothetical protein [Acuticoccus kalidii]
MSDDDLKMARALLSADTIIVGNVAKRMVSSPEIYRYFPAARSTITREEAQ